MNARRNASRQLLLWGLSLFVLTSLGIAYLWANDLTPDDMSLGVILIAYSPSLAALIAAITTQTTRELFSQVVRWRAPAWVYLIAVGLPIVAVGGALMLSGASNPAIIIDFAGIGIGIGAIIAGSLGEELGWRGYLQPRLMRRCNLFWASIIVGLIWATWHCWTILAPQGLSGDWLLDTALTYLRLVPTALLYGWLYYISKRSLPVVMIAHAAHNIAINSLIVPASAHSFGLVLAVLYCLLGIILVTVRRQDFYSATPIVPTTR